MNAYSLIESTPTDLKLSESQAIALSTMGEDLASKSSWFGAEDAGEKPQRSVVTCIPVRSGIWRVTVLNAVGVISVNGLQLVVSPKIPLPHLIYLFVMADVLPRFANSVTEMAPGGTLLELVAHWYLRAVDAVLRSDLVKDYREEAAELTQPRGRVDVRKTTDLYYSGRVRFACTFEEFDANTPLNRMLKAAARAVASNRHLQENTRRRGRRIAQRFEGVGELEVTDTSVVCDRRTAAYRDALMLARLLLRNQSRELIAGESKGWSFLIPTPAAVEDGIRAVLTAGLGPQVQLTKRRLRIKPTNLTVNPDLYFLPQRAVGDIKYKVVDTEWLRSDLYQSVAFAAAFRTSRAAVVMFGCGSFALPAVQFGEIEAYPLIWEAAEEKSPATAAADLVERTRSWLDRERVFSIEANSQFATSG